MSWIILVDLRENNGHFVTLEDEHGNIAQFPTKQAAKEAMRGHPLDAYPSCAISVDEDEINYL